MDCFDFGDLEIEYVVLIYNKGACNTPNIVWVVTSTPKICIVVILKGQFSPKSNSRQASL